MIPTNLLLVSVSCSTNKDNTFSNQFVQCLSHRIRAHLTLHPWTTRVITIPSNIPLESRSRITGAIWVPVTTISVRYSACSLVKIISRRTRDSTITPTIRTDRRILCSKFRVIWFHLVEQLLGIKSCFNTRTSRSIQIQYPLVCIVCPPLSSAKARSSTLSTMSTIVCSCCICSIGICSIICSTNSCCAKSCEPNRAIRCCIISPPVYCNATYRNSCSIPSRFKSSSRTCIKKVWINIVWSINNQIKSIASSITVEDITLNHIRRTKDIWISITICGAVTNVSNIRWIIKFNMT